MSSKKNSGPTPQLDGADAAHALAANDNGTADEPCGNCHMCVVRREIALLDRALYDWRDALLSRLVPGAARNEIKPEDVDHAVMLRMSMMVRHDIVLARVSGVLTGN